MHATLKTLTEMTMGEREAMVATVMQALNDAAEHADADGETSLCANFTAMAGMLAGGSDDLAFADLTSVELLLQHAVTLLQLYSARADQSRVLH